MLTRSRLQEDGLVKVTGRDVPEGEYAVQFQDGHHWALNGDDLAAAAATARSTRAIAGLGDRAADIVETVAKLGQASPADVAEQLGMDPAKVRVYLGRLADSSRLIRVKRGLHAPTPPVTSVTSVTSDEEATTEHNSSNGSNGPPGGRLWSPPVTG